MIEYLYDAIRAVAGQEINISAVVTNAEGAAIERGCVFMLHTSDSAVTMTPGEYVGEGLWQFNIPAEATAGLQGRYWYCIQHEGNNLCFKQPIYFK